MLHPVFTQRFRPSRRTQHLTPKGGEAPRAARCTVARHHFPYFLWRHDLLTSKNSVTPWALCQLRHSTALCCLYEPPTPTLHLSVSSVNVGPRHPRFQPACAESVYQCHCPLHEGLLFHARRKNSFRCCYHRPLSCPPLRLRHRGAQQCKHSPRRVTPPRPCLLPIKSALTDFVLTKPAPAFTTGGMPPVR